MNLRQLEIFTSVIETKSFSRAAEALFISQPSVSISITQLEKDLDTKLLNRTTKLVTPTEAGMLLYERAKKIITLCKNTQSDVYEIANPNDFSKLERTLDICAPSLAADYILPEQIAKFRKKYPKITINVSSLDSCKIIKKVLDQELDFGIVGFKSKDDHLETKEIGHDQLVLISKTPLEQESLKEVLESMPFIDRETGSGTRECYQQYFKKMKIDRSQMNIMTSFTDTASVVQAVVHGLGVAIVPERATKRLEQDAIQICKHIELPARKIYLIRRKKHQLPTAAKLFVQELLKNN